MTSDVIGVRVDGRVVSATFVRGALLAVLVVAVAAAATGSGEASFSGRGETLVTTAGERSSAEHTLPFGLSGDVRDYGPRAGLPVRKASGSIKVTKRRSVVENLTITGSLTVAADKVRIRNVAFIAPSTWTWQQRNNFVNVRRGSTGTVIEDSTFDGSNEAGVPVVYDAVAASDVVLRRSDITKVANGIEFGSGTVVDCFFHEIWHSGPESQWHADAIQSNQGSGITVRNNYIRMGRPPAGYWSQTSAIGMWSDLDSRSVLENVLVTHNVIEPLGGFVFYAGITNGVPGATVSNVVFSENVVRRAGGLSGDYGVWYQTADHPVNATRTGNVYDDGTAIPPDA